MTNTAEKVADRIRILNPITGMKRGKYIRISGSDLIQICGNMNGHEKEVSDIFSKLDEATVASILERNDVMARLPEYYEVLSLIKTTEGQTGYVALADEAQSRGYDDILLSYDRQAVADAVSRAGSISWEDAAIMLPYFSQNAFLNSLTVPTWQKLYQRYIPQSLDNWGKDGHYGTSDELLCTLTDKKFYAHPCVRVAASCGNEVMPILINRYKEDPVFLDLLDMMALCGDDFAEDHIKETWQYDKIKDAQGIRDAITAGAGDKKYDFEELKEIILFVWYELPYADERTLHRLTALLRDADRRKEFLQEKHSMKTAYLFGRTDVLAWKDTDWWKRYDMYCTDTEYLDDPDEYPIISYAIMTRKNNFINIIGEGDMYDFLRWEKRQPLPLFEEWFNLNTFNKKELRDFMSEDIKFAYLRDALKRLDRKNLTFGEIELFAKLDRERKMGEDERTWLADLLKAMTVNIRSEAACLRIQQYMKALPKKTAYPKDVEELAELLSEKDIPAWAETLYDFRASLPLTAVSLPYHNTGILNGISDEETAWFAIRNADTYAKKREDGKDADTAIQEILDVDEDVIWLKKEMGLDGLFYDEYANETRKFFIEGDASIARRYMESLTVKRRETFKLIAKAAMCGKLKKLRFQENDIDIECGTTLSPNVKEVWIRDDSIAMKGYTCGEDSSFRGIMQMGKTPVRTCMNYRDGMYNQCLMAYFDANKKIVYVRDKEGKPVARAVLRITQVNFDGQGSNRLSFKDVENDRNTSEEQPALFLEKMYSGYQDAQREMMENILTEFAKQKAQAAGIPLVIANCYTMPEDAVMRDVSVYITKSKAGDQYLDSFGGLAGPDGYADDRYVKGRFPTISVR